MKKSKDTFVRERKKLRKFYKMVKRGEIEYDIVEKQYKSWKGTVTRKRSNARYMFKNHKQVESVDKLYSQLFLKEDS